jgi:hypothetical protein
MQNFPLFRKQFKAGHSFQFKLFFWCFPHMKNSLTFVGWQLISCRIDALID